MSDHVPLYLDTEVNKKFQKVFKFKMSPQNQLAIDFIEDSRETTPWKIEAIETTLPPSCRGLVGRPAKQEKAKFGNINHKVGCLDDIECLEN